MNDFFVRSPLLSMTNLQLLLSVLFAYYRSIYMVNSFDPMLVRASIIIRVG